MASKALCIGINNYPGTYYALKTLREIKPATYQKWFDAIRTYLPSTRLPQSPQILGTRKPRSFKVFK
jgi:hypothetical protein